MWRAVEREPSRVVMEHILHPQPGYPFALLLRVEYRLDGDGLTVHTTAENVGERACPFGVGHHPYIAAPTGRVDDLVIDGALLGAQKLDEPRRMDAPWRMQVDDVTVWADEQRLEHVQLFTGDPLPDVARRSFAVEPMTCPPNAFRTGEDLIRLEPGETFSGVGIAVVKKRLDVLLTERGLAASRTQAQAFIMAGLVPGYDKSSRRPGRTPWPARASAGGEGDPRLVDPAAVLGRQGVGRERERPGRTGTRRSCRTVPGQPVQHGAMRRCVVSTVPTLSVTSRKNTASNTDAVPVTCMGLVTVAPAAGSTMVTAGTCGGAAARRPPAPRPAAPPPSRILRRPSHHRHPRDGARADGRAQGGMCRHAARYRPPPCSGRPASSTPATSGTSARRWCTTSTSGTTRRSSTSSWPPRRSCASGPTRLAEARNRGYHAGHARAHRAGASRKPRPDRAPVNGNGLRLRTASSWPATWPAPAGRPSPAARRDPVPRLPDRAARRPPVRRARSRS